MMRNVFTPLERSPQEQSRRFVRWTLLLCAAVALAVVLALTVFGEFRSISGTIDRIPPLRFIDSLGRSESREGSG